MDIVKSILQNRSVIYEKLIPYGFHFDGRNFAYKEKISGSGLEVRVIVSRSGEISAEVCDPISQEPYVLHIVDKAVGDFVGKVRKKYIEILQNIAKECCRVEIFKFEQSKELIDYVQETYGDQLEFLWAKSPDNAIWRRQDNRKWYGVMLKILKSKLGLSSDEVVETVNFRVLPEDIDYLLEQKGFYPGWHMNKKHWITTILDHSISSQKIFNLINQSYKLAKK